MDKIKNLLFRGRRYGDEKHIKIYIENILPMELTDKYCLIHRGIDKTRKNDLHITVYVMCEDYVIDNKVKLYDRIVMNNCTVGVEWIIVDI